MKIRKKISVAMAAYNGVHYIDEQILSILPQLMEEDELIISCDPSSDGTWECLQAYAVENSHISVFQGPGNGILQNFQNALLHCKNDYIFLCDQDDIWLPDKVDKVLQEFEKKDVGLVMHDAKIVDAELNEVHPSFFSLHGCRTGIFHNIIKNSYIGCCMAIRRDILNIVLPFPDDLPMHDQWIGILAEKRSFVSLLKEPLILYRRHQNNASALTHAGFIRMLQWRITLIKRLRERCG